MLTWLAELLTPSARRWLGEKLFGDGYHLYLCYDDCDVCTAREDSDTMNECGSQSSA